MKKMSGLLVLLSLCSLLFAATAFAGKITSTVDKILLYEDGMLVYVYPTDQMGSPPSCHGSNGNYYSFSTTRPMAKMYLAALMSAQARGATVAFQGTNTCNDQSNSETLSYFHIE